MKITLLENLILNRGLMYSPLGWLWCPTYPPPIRYNGQAALPHSLRGLSVDKVYEQKGIFLYACAVVVNSIT